MSEENKAIVRRLVAAINQRDEASFLAVLTPDVIDHYALPGLPPGREGWNLNRKILRAAFPDGCWHEEDLFAEGDRVVGRYTLRGTHLGNLWAFPLAANRSASPTSTSCAWWMARLLNTGATATTWG